MAVFGNEQISYGSSGGGIERGGGGLFSIDKRTSLASLACVRNARLACPGSRMIATPPLGTPE